MRISIDKVFIRRAVVKCEHVCKRRVLLDFKVFVCLKRQKKRMTVQLTNEQKVQVTLNPKTEAGTPVAVENPQWSVVSGDATLEVADDGMSAWIISPDSPGQSQVLVEADADLGEGVETISATIDVQVIGAKATVLGLEVGAPVLKNK